MFSFCGHSFSRGTGRVGHISRSRTRLNQKFRVFRASVLNSLLNFHSSFFFPTRCAQTKRPPGNWAAFSQGRIVPTEARPSKLSAEILGFYKGRVKQFLGLKLLSYQ